MEIMSFTGKELATQEKVISCFNFNTTATMGLKQCLNLRRNLRLPKWLNFSRILVSNLPYLVMHWKYSENNIKNCINIDLKCLIDLALRMKFSKLFNSLTQK